MTVTPQQRRLLKQYGFQWYKNSCTDRVEAETIQAILPAAHGFTVVYAEPTPDHPLVLRYSTATVEQIDFPVNLKSQWIQVHWLTIEDERRA